MRIFAVLPAAGASSRFGRPKLLLTWRGRTLLEHAIQALQAAVERVVVVTPPSLPQLAELAAAAGATPVRLHEPTADMRATIQVGLDWLATQEAPSPSDACFVTPADVPGISAEVVRLLAAAARSDSAHSLFVPACSGRRGHPLLLRWSHVAGLRASPAGLGLNSYLRNQSESIREVPFDEPALLADIDTPDDLRRLLGKDAEEMK